MAYPGKSFNKPVLLLCTRFREDCPCKQVNNGDSCPPPLPPELHSISLRTLRQRSCGLSRVITLTSHRSAVRGGVVGFYHGGDQIIRCVAGHVSRGLHVSWFWVHSLTLVIAWFVCTGSCGDGATDAFWGWMTNETRIRQLSSACGSGGRLGSGREGLWSGGSWIRGGSPTTMTHTWLHKAAPVWSGGGGSGLEGLPEWRWHKHNPERPLSDGVWGQASIHNDHDTCMTHKAAPASYRILHLGLDIPQLLLQEQTISRFRLFQVLCTKNWLTRCTYKRK